VVRMRWMLERIGRGDHPPRARAGVFETLILIGLRLSVFRPLAMVVSHHRNPRNRKAFTITEAELKLIAAPAMMGLSSTPKNG